MSWEKLVEKYGLKNRTHALLLLITMILVIAGLALTLREFASARGNLFWYSRLAISIFFFFAAIVFAIIGYRYSGLTHVRILIAVRLIGVVLNIIACMYAATVEIQWWIYGYLIAILVGLIFFYALLDKPKAASLIIISLIMIAAIYSIARIAILQQTAAEAFRPVLFEYTLAIIYWSKQTREGILKTQEDK